jgi:hypothetical protein
MYLESDNIVIGQNFGTDDRADITTVSSPTWLDWVGPGTLIAAFLLSLGPNHTPLLHCAFSFLLLKQALLVCISISL